MPNYPVTLDNGTKIWLEKSKTDTRYYHDLKDLFPKATFFEQRFHRTDGPAIIRNNGSKEWWLHGKRFHDFDNWAYSVGLSSSEALLMKMSYM